MKECNFCRPIKECQDLRGAQRKITIFENGKFAVQTRPEPIVLCPERKKMYGKFTFKEL
jgi:hypothetical protein